MLNIVNSVRLGNGSLKRNQAVSFTYNGKKRFARIKIAALNKQGESYISCYDISAKAFKSYRLDKMQDVKLVR